MKKTITFILFLMLVLTLMSHAQTVNVKDQEKQVSFNIQSLEIEIAATEETKEQAFVRARQLIRATKPKMWRFYDIYVVTPKGTYYQNYSLKRKTIKI